MVTPASPLPSTESTLRPLSYASLILDPAAAHAELARSLDDLKRNLCTVDTGLRKLLDHGRNASEDIEEQDEDLGGDTDLEGD